MRFFALSCGILLDWTSIRKMRLRGSVSYCVGNVSYVTLPALMMASVVAPFVLAGSVSMLIYGDTFGGLLLLAGLAVCMGIIVGLFLHAKSQGSAIVTVYAAEESQLEALVMDELGIKVEDYASLTAARSAAFQGLSWSKDGVCYSIDYDEVLSQYSLSTSVDSRSGSLPVNRLRRLLQVV